MNQRNGFVDTSSGCHAATLTVVGVVVVYDSSHNSGGDGEDNGGVCERIK